MANERVNELKIQAKQIVHARHQFVSDMDQAEHELRGKLVAAEEIGHQIT